MRHGFMTRWMLLGILCFSPNSLFAAMEMPVGHGVGSVFALCGDAVVYADLAPVVTSQKSGRFFDTLEPETSTAGGVKTFVVVNSQNGKSPKKVSGVENSEIAAGSSQNLAFLKHFNGTFIMPVAGEITSRFGYRMHPFRKVRRFHSGIDIRAKRGAPISAAAEGRVVYAGWKRGYGLMIEVEHGNSFKSVYAHCSKLYVRSGTVVKSGEKIASVGSTGVTTGPHLHFEIIRGSKLLNPLSFFNNV